MLRKLTVILGILLLGAAFKWPPKAWPPTDLPTPITSTTQPALIQALIPVMRSGTDGATTPDQMKWMGEFPQAFYEDILGAEKIAECEAREDFCMIAVGNCMTVRYGKDEKFVLWDPVACQKQAELK